MMCCKLEKQKINRRKKKRKIEKDKTERKKKMCFEVWGPHGQGRKRNGLIIVVFVWKSLRPTEFSMTIILNAWICDHSSDSGFFSFFFCSFVVAIGIWKSLSYNDGIWNQFASQPELVQSSSIQNESKSAKSSSPIKFSQVKSIHFASLYA